MTLNSNSNFEEKFDFRLNNDMRNLVNFNANCGKSENVYFDRLLLLKVRNV